MTTKKLRKLLQEDGWYKVNQEGSHVQLKHPVKPGKVTIPKHSGDIAIGTLKRIYQQAGLK